MTAYGAEGPEATAGKGYTFFSARKQGYRAIVTNSASNGVHATRQKDEGETGRKGRPCGTHQRVFFSHK